jgi:hypothetical protein
LRLDVGAVGRVERHRRGIGIAEDIDVREVLAGFACLDRRQHLIGRATGIGLARRQARKAGRKLRPQPGAEDGDDHVAIGGFRDLVLKRPVGGVVACFPADGFDPHAPFEFGVQPFDDEVDAAAFVGHIARRGNENSENLLGQWSAPVCSPTRNRRSAMPKAE